MNKIYFLDSTSKYGFNTANHTSDQAGNNVVDLVLEKWGGPLRAGRIQLAPGRWGEESYSLRLYGYNAGGSSGVQKGLCTLKVPQPVPNFTLGFALKPRTVTPHELGVGSVSISEYNQWLTFHDASGIARYGLLINRESAGTQPTGAAIAITQPITGVWDETAGNNGNYSSPVIPFDPDKWYYFEVNIASGTDLSTDIAVKINGKPFFTAGQGTYHNIQEVKFHSNYGSVSGDMYVDGYYTDLYVSDGFINGACTSRVWVPEHRPRNSSMMYQDMASGNLSQWSVVGAPRNYAALHEKPHSSGQYVSANVSGLIDTYSFPQPSSVFQPVGNIHGVALNMGLMPMGSTTEIKGLYYNMQGSSKHYFAESGVMPEGEYKVKQHIMAYNPMGTSVWIATDLGSGVGQFGMVRAI